MGSRRMIAFLVCSVFCAAGCEDAPEYKGLRFTTTDTPPDGYDTVVDSRRVTIPAGIVQPIEAAVEYRGDRYLIGSFVDLSSSDEEVFGALSMPGKNRFLLIGRTPGRTCMGVTVNGNYEECIEVTVE